MSAKQVRKLTGKPISSKGFTGKGDKKLKKKAKTVGKKTVSKAKKLKL